MSYIHNKTKSVCLVCDEKLDDSNCVNLHKTRRQTHNLCGYCARGYLKPLFQTIINNIRMNIRTKDIGLVRCPGGYHGQIRNRCRAMISIRQIQTYKGCDLEEDIFRIGYVLNKKNAYLCTCGFVVEVDREYGNQNLFCGSCKSSWCRDCAAQPYHINKTCVEYEVESKSTDGAQYIMEMNKRGLIKFCPQCKIPTYRSAGCNKITCNRCNMRWCWLCSAENITYDHYTRGTCNKKLWKGTIEK